MIYTTLSMFALQSSSITEMCILSSPWFSSVVFLSLNPLFYQTISHHFCGALHNTLFQYWRKAHHLQGHIYWTTNSIAPLPWRRHVSLPSPQCWPPWQATRTMSIEVTDFPNPKLATWRLWEVLKSSGAVLQRVGGRMTEGSGWVGLDGQMDGQKVGSGEKVDASR